MTYTTDPHASHPVYADTGFCIECNTTAYATTYRVQYPADDGWTLTTTVDFPTLALLLGSPTEALSLIFRGPGAMMWDLKLLACDTYGDPSPLR